MRQLTDDAQVVTDDYSFDGWGKLTSSTGSTANSQLYKGEYLAYRKDPDAGPELQYSTHHRNYNPQTGVFTAADPAKDDLNLYRYVKNNPVNEVDPSGLQEEKNSIQVEQGTRLQQNQQSTSAASPRQAERLLAELELDTIFLHSQINIRHHELILESLRLKLASHIRQYGRPHQGRVPTGWKPPESTLRYLEIQQAIETEVFSQAVSHKQARRETAAAVKAYVDSVAAESQERKELKGSETRQFQNWKAQFHSQMLKKYSIGESEDEAWRNEKIQQWTQNLALELIGIGIFRIAANSARATTAVRRAEDTLEAAKRVEAAAGHVDEVALSGAADAEKVADAVPSTLDNVDEAAGTLKNADAPATSSGTPPSGTSSPPPEPTVSISTASPEPPSSAPASSSAPNEILDSPSTNSSTTKLDDGNVAAPSNSARAATKPAVPETGPTPKDGDIFRLADIASRTQKTLRSVKGRILQLADDSRIGVRGSVARGMGLARDANGNVTGFKRFNPDEFDIDAFVVSDKLASKVRKFGEFRSGRSNTELQKISDEIHEELKSMFPGLKGDKKFNFRVFTEKEWAEKFGPQAPFFFID